MQSILNVTTPAASHDLVTLDAVKAEMGIADASDDARLTEYIHQASDAVTTFCNRVFAQEGLMEVFRLRDRTPELILQRHPIVAVNGVEENGQALAPSDYQVDMRSGIVMRLRGTSPTCFRPGMVAVAYTAGYAIPDALPFGIARATLLLVKQYAAASDRDPLIRSEAIDGAGSTEYFSARQTGLPPEVEGLLTPHCAIGLA